MRLLIAMALAMGSTSCLSEEEVGTVAGAGWVSCGEYAQSFQKDPEGSRAVFLCVGAGLYVRAQPSALDPKEPARVVTG